MNMDESIQVSCIIEKLSPSWKDFKHTLKHLKEELTLIELGSHLRIEESPRAQDNDKPKSNNVASPSVVNMVEHNNSFRYNDNKGKRKHHDTRAKPNKKPKVTCWKCGKPGHLKKDYKSGNVGNRANGSSTKGSEDGSSNPLKDRCWFKTYESLNDGSILHMGNKSTSLVHGRGCVDLRLNIVSDNIGSPFMSTSKLNDSILWHARLGHVHFKRMQYMFKDGLIPAFDMDTEKCQTYMLNKITKKPFQNVKRKTEVLELIHSHLCDLHATPLLGNKKYLVTFIDDASRTDRRGEYMDTLYFQSVGIIHETTAPYTLQQNGTRDEVSDHNFYCFNVVDDPKTFDEAMKSQDVAFWKEAINDEMDSIMGNNTWVLTDLPPGYKPLGIDYFDTYALVTRISTIRLLIAMALIHNMIIHQMDVKTTFLNRELEEEVYMNQPLGFILPGNKNKDMGEADVILGIRIKDESNGITISQSYYIKKVLKKFNYSDCTLVSTPLDTYEKLMPIRGLDVSQLEYSRVIGCLMYAMTYTRPDIAFAVGKLSRYTSNPGTQHWQAIQRVLKKTMDYRLMYSRYPSVLEGYIDASWISNTEDNSSTSGWVFVLAAGKEAEWLKNLLLEIPLWVKPMAPIFIRCDSAATLAKAYSQMHNRKSRHLGVRHSMIRELITNGVVSIEFVRSQQNLADHLTKGLAKDLVIKSAEGM
ncbi:zinc finger, CCHC-type containing protein [Tanacetum coccineum]